MNNQRLIEKNKKSKEMRNSCSKKLTYRNSCMSSTHLPTTNRNIKNSLTKSIPKQNKNKMVNIINELQTKIKQLKKCYHQLAHNNQKENAKQLLRVNPKSNLISQNPQSIISSQEIDDLRRSYLSLYGKDTNNLVQLYNFYKRNIQQSKCLLGSLSMSSKAYSLSITNYNKSQIKHEELKQQNINEYEKKDKVTNYNGQIKQKSTSQLGKQFKRLKNLQQYQNVMKLLSEDQSNCKINQIKIQEEINHKKQKQNTIKNKQYINQNLRLQNVIPHRNLENKTDLQNQQSYHIKFKNSKDIKLSKYSSVSQIQENSFVSNIKSKQKSKIGLKLQSPCEQNYPISSVKKTKSGEKKQEKASSNKKSNKDQKSESKNKKFMKNQGFDNIINLDEGILFEQLNLNKGKNQIKKAKYSQNYQYYVKPGPFKMSQNSLSDSSILNKEQSTNQFLDLDFIPLDL